ncbi:MAG: hypothetical protein ABMB14_12130 [Myxococcota bacterium]
MRWSGAIVLVACAGCHARFKHHVDAIDAVRPEIRVTTGPSVLLGGVVGDGLVAAVVNVTQAVRSVQAADRLASAVDIGGVNSAFGEGLVKALGDGPPFGSAPDAGDVMQIEVESYGLSAPVIGMAGSFTYDLHVEIFLDTGKKVYDAHQSCEVGFGDATALARAIGVVDNVHELAEMTDAEIQGAFEYAAKDCAGQFVDRLRRHASSNRLPDTMPAPSGATGTAAPPPVARVTTD